MIDLGLGSIEICGRAHYETGLRIAWGPVRRWESADSVGMDWAARELALGHVVLMTAMLSALAAYLMRGKGDPAARARILQEIRESPRLGHKVADWVVANEEALARHPALKPKEQQVTMAAVPAKDVGPPITPAELRRLRDEGPPSAPNAVDAPKKLEPPAPPKVMPQKKVRCFDPANRNPDVSRRARAEYQKKMATKLTDQFIKGGMSPKAAEAKAMNAAADRMKTLAALHHPDMVAAGKDVIADFGDRNINSRIGAQWKTQGRVDSLDEAARRIPSTERGAMKMNAKLERCI